MNEARARPLTVILGSGASISAGIPSTERITEQVREALGTFIIPAANAHLAEGNALGLSSAASLADLIVSALRSQFRIINFELMLHALEQLEPLAAAHDPALSERNRPVLSAFVQMLPRYEILSDSRSLAGARRDAVLAIMRAVHNAPHITDPQSVNASARLNSLFQALSERFRLTVITLNYDRLAESSSVAWFDGYTNRCGDYDFSTFSPQDWWQEQTHPAHDRLLHLHGSIGFGYAPGGISHVLSQFGEPVKYDSLETAIQSVRYSTASISTVDGFLYEGSPVISGLQKAGKLMYNVRPYGYYYWTAADALLRSPRLLVIGYGARDEHLNEWIYEYMRVNDDNRRTVIVTRIPGTEVGENTDEIRLIRSLSAGYFRESNAWEGAADGFQALGPNLRLLPRGFPFELEVQESVIEFLDTAP